MCCLPVLIRSLHAAHTCFFSCCPPVSICRSTWLSLVTSVVTPSLEQRLECDAHCRVCTPRVEAGRSLHSLHLAWSSSPPYAGSHPLRSVVPRQSLDNSREWLVAPGGSTALALHSLWQGQHSQSHGLCAVQCAEGFGQLSHRRLVLVLQALSGLHVVQPSTHVR